MKAILRSMALRVPPIGNLYNFALQQARENQARAATVDAMTAQHAAAMAALKAELAGREEHLLGELAAAAEERDALDLQLYVLRSDHQRAAVRNQELSGALRAAEDKALTAEQTLQARSRDFDAALRAAEDTKRAAEERARKAVEERSVPGVTPQDLSLLYAKLAGRMTLLGSEIARLQPSMGASTSGRTLYLDLLERALTGMLHQDSSIAPWTQGYDPETRLIGRDWPRTAQTMIGLARTRNLRVLTEQVVQEGIPGDLLEAGVWRGGACILMRGVLQAYGIPDRTVWVADSFAGLPAPDPTAYPADYGDQHVTVDALRVSSEEVRTNFERYGLLDKQVRFLKGWFDETLATAPIDRLAILRLDGDMYSSTIQTLDALYGKVTTGGFIIIDDYILAGCRQAVDDFRESHDIRDELNDIDGAAVFWRKG